jgi:phytanoyl-CoA dioxygenase PhyH
MSASSDTLPWGGPLLLNTAQQDQFVEDGYLVVGNVFDQAVADELVALVWRYLEEDPFSPSERLRRHPQLEQVIEEGPIDALLSPRLGQAVDALVGAGRWWTRRGFGWVTIRMPVTAGGGWRPPDSGWHVDGIHFQHLLTSKEQGLVGIEMLTPSHSQRGATMIKRGSHRYVARALHAAGEAGIPYAELRRFSEELAGCDAVEAVGETGDVLLMHPHLVHARSMNCGPHQRLAANRCFGLHQPMTIIDEPKGGHSLVEKAIRLAVGLE